MAENSFLVVAHAADFCTRAGGTSSIEYLKYIDNDYSPVRQRQ